MTRPRASGPGRRFELVLLRLRPPTPRTVGLIAKHASEDAYHWVMVLGRVHATPENLARLLAVAYLDEASGLLGRGDPRWSVPRAFLRSDGTLETDRPGRSGEETPDTFVREELHRIATWLRRRHRDYLSDLRQAFREGAPDARFRALDRAGGGRRGMLDPTGRGLVAPDPPAVVTRTRPRAPGAPEDDGPAGRPAWREAATERG